jgi:hypothetical protein
MLFRLSNPIHELSKGVACVVTKHCDVHVVAAVYTHCFDGHV